MTEELLPPEPGTVPDPDLGLSDEDADFPPTEASDDDQERGDAEELEGDDDGDA